MTIFNQQLLLSLLIGTTCIAAPRNLFEEMIEEMNDLQARFERRMNRFHEEMKKAFDAPLNNGIDSPTISISENKTNNCIEVTVHPLATKEKVFDATMDQDSNSMTISTPLGSILIQTNHHLISVGFNHQTKQEQNQKGNKAQIMMSSYSQNARTLTGEVTLEEAHIEYDTAGQKLIISIPFFKKSITKIPVTIKEAAKIEEK